MAGPTRAPHGVCPFGAPRAGVGPPAPAGKDTLFWHKGASFGDVSVTLPLPRLAPDASFSLVLAEEEKDWEQGYALLVTAAAPGEVALSLTRRGKTMGTKRIAVASLGSRPPLCFRRQGSFLAADIQGRLVLQYQDAAPLAASRLGLRAAAVTLDLREAAVRSRNRYEYTFHIAPVDWRPQWGQWEIMNRWACSPQWSWFGGVSESLAVVWSKRRFAGDLVLDYYAAPKMDAVPENYVLRYRDMNATICGDGERLDSGYSFIICGWHNTRTVILRGDRVVAETTQYQMPPQRTGHRQWFYVHVEKRGNRLSLSVDNQPLLTFVDPDPLPGQRVALWTQNNGMMVARAEFSYEREEDAPWVVRPAEQGGPTVPAPDPVGAAVQPPLAAQAGGAAGEWQGVTARVAAEPAAAEGPRRTLAITNLEPGGEFKVIARPQPFDPEVDSHLTFAYRIPPRVYVNVYVRTAGKYYAIALTGEGRKSLGFAVAGRLGRIEDVQADGAWHRASFDLLAALRALFPGERPPHVDEVVLANWDPSDEYIRAGVAGNALGTTYHVRGFRIGPAAVAPRPPVP